ncbi:MAG: hypothetical protein JOY78_16825 [Pseudonocardia sp.]|nr:hypothetical protein [Pseudonocardia sp.]
MPIRSPHGRSAAYRVLWQWPLRSPTHLVATGVAVLAVVVAATTGIGITNGSVAVRGGATPTPTAAAGPAPSAEAPLPPVPELEPTTLPVSAAPAAALQVASRWARAWVRPPDGTTSAKWLAGLRTTTTDEYLGVLVGVDPSNIPATKVTGPARALSVAPRSLRVQVPTDALTLVITVVDTDAGWRVSGYDRA